MINLQKINWKLNITNPEIFDSTLLFKIFNTWIPASPEVFVDVADYRHVKDGPLVILVGHFVDYAWDHADYQHGFLYNGRQPTEGSNQEKIVNSLTAFLKAAKRFRDAPEWKTKPQFKTDELTFLVNDRGLVPNTEDTFKQVKPELEQVMGQILQTPAEIIHQNNPKQRFSARIKFVSPFALV